jgi:Mg-chelatase subunit ChlD
MKKRILASILSLVLLFSLLPVSTLAAKQNDELQPGTVKATKTLLSDSPDADGAYTIQLSVQGAPVTTTAKSQADVVLVVDNSGSMGTRVGETCGAPKNTFEESGGFPLLYKAWTCPTCGMRYISSWLGVLWDERPDFCIGEIGSEPRIDTAKNVAQEFAESILGDTTQNRLAVIGFSHGKDKGGANDSDAIRVAQDLTRNVSEINTAIDKMEADGGTNYTAALEQAYEYLNGRDKNEKSRPAYVVFISDGAPGRSGESQDDPDWNGEKQIAALKQMGATVYTIGINLDDDAGAYLKSMASTSAHYQNVTGTDYAEKLSAILTEWAEQINTVPAGTNAVLTDVVNPAYFELVTDQTLPAGLTSSTGADGTETLTWDIGDIPAQAKTVSFKIKVKDGVLENLSGEQTVPTNENVFLTYTDSDQKEQMIPQEQIGKPEVTLTGTQVPETTYTLIFNANGGTWGETTDEGYTPSEDGTTLTRTGILGSERVSPLTNLPVQSNKLFAGWDAEIDGEKVDCSPLLSQSPAMGRLHSLVKGTTNNTVILYAHWTEPQPGMRSYQIVQHYMEAPGHEDAAVSIQPLYAAEGTAISTLIQGKETDQSYYGQTYLYEKTTVTPAGDTLTQDNTVIDLYYYLDAWEDGTPDYKQIRIEYHAAPALGGTVTPAYEVHTLSESGELTLTGSTAEAKDGFVFSKWVVGGPADAESDTAPEAGTEAKLVPQIPEPKGGTTYAYTALFTKVNPEEPEEPEEPVKPAWDTSKSKTATQLNNDFLSNVTLSLPSAEEKLVTDVVFVLDKSTSADLEDAALEMLQDLKGRIDATNAQVQVGVVIFNKEAHVANDGKFFDLSTEYEDITAAFMADISSGTNTHAGLLAGKAMLDADTAVSADRKYLIFVSDGITYMYNAEPTVTAWKFNQPNAAGDWHGKGSWGIFSGPDNWESKYHTNDAPKNWDVWMETISSQVNAQGTTYEYPYGGTAGTVTPEDLQRWDTDYAMSVDKALYLTNQVYQEAKTSGYHCYAMPIGTNTENLWGPSFMDYLADGENVSFNEIQNDIYYLLDAGSKVVDVIGSGTDNQGSAYHFDFVNDPAALTLTVDGTKLDVTRIDDTTYGFGKAQDSVYPFVLHYYATGEDGQSDECFVWDINQPVSNFAPVQLTYTVKLTDPVTENNTSASITHGQYDEDGSEGYQGGLYTNNSAVLYPVDSNKTEGQPEFFAKPTVSYTVPGKEIPDHGGSDGDDDDDKSETLNTKDHYSYIIGYKDGTVRPYGTITRGEVATIFFRMLTDEARDKYWSQENPYADCGPDLWCNNAISTLTNMGVIDGFQDGNFRPYGKITRAQFAKIAVGFFETTAKEYQGYFTDVAPDAWYTSYIEAAARVGLIQGFEDGTYRPNENITRAQACVIVNRALGRKPHEEHLLPEKKMIVWPDNNPGDWYYADMQEATNSHDYTWVRERVDGEWKKTENWTKKLKQRDWAAFEHAWSTAHSAPFSGEVIKD